MPDKEKRGRIKDRITRSCGKHKPDDKAIDSVLSGPGMDTIVKMITGQIPADPAVGNATLIQAVATMEALATEVNASGKGNALTHDVEDFLELILKRHAG